MFLGHKLLFLHLCSWFLLRSLKGSPLLGAAPRSGSASKSLIGFLAPAVGQTRGSCRGAEVTSKDGVPNLKVTVQQSSFGK